MNYTFKARWILCILFCFPFSTFAQDNELDTILDKDTKEQKEYVNHAFKSPRVINGHSIEMVGKGVLDFRILHRFGMISGGWREMFGLDLASMRMSFDYGLTRDMSIGIGRSTFNKEVDGFVKYRFAHQRKGAKPFPLSLVWVSGITLNTTKITDPKLNVFSYRLGYYHQLLMGKKFGEIFTLQLSPTFVHRNLVPTTGDKNDAFALGIGTRLKISNRTAFIIETFPMLSGARSGYNTLPLSVGFDIETGGHVFQLHISNSRGMNEKAFITETVQDWTQGQINFGFNLSRVFTIVKNTEGSW